MSMSPLSRDQAQMLLIKLHFQSHDKTKLQCILTTSYTGKSHVSDISVDNTKLFSSGKCLKMSINSSYKRVLHNMFTCTSQSIQNLGCTKSLGTPNCPYNSAVIWSNCLKEQADLSSQEVPVTRHIYIWTLMKRISPTQVCNMKKLKVQVHIYLNMQVLND